MADKVLKVKIILKIKFVFWKSQSGLKTCFRIWFRLPWRPAPITTISKNSVFFKNGTKRKKGKPKADHYFKTRQYIAIICK